MAITLDGMAESGYLAPELSGEIFQSAIQRSVVGQIAGTTSMGLTGNEYVIAGAQPEAGIVGEGGSKPVGDFGFSTKVVRPVKAALIVTWSKEARQKNPAGIFDDLQSQMAAAIQRQVDMAVLYGKSARDGASISGVEHLNLTENRVELGTATKANGGLTSDFLTGYDQVTEAGYDFTAFAADPRLRSQLIGATDMQGRPVYQSEVSLSSGMGNLLGLPVAYGKGVSGRVGENTDTGVRAFGGDFDGNLKLGFVENINFKTTDQATVDNVSLWQTNQEAALVEAIFGWVINDVNAFTAYEAAAPTASWAAETKYAVGDQATLSTGETLTVTKSGTSGTTEPTAPSAGSTVTDGTVTWKLPA